MRRALLVGALAAALWATAGYAQDAVKIGVIMPYSGQFADPGIQSDNGIKLYLKEHGGNLGGKDVEGDEAAFHRIILPEFRDQW